MQEKTVEIQFNYDDHVDTRNSLWGYTFQKVATGYLLYSAIPILILIFHFLFDSNDPLTLIAGVGMLLYTFYKWYSIYRSRKKYYEDVIDAAEYHQNELSEQRYIFSEDHIEYQDQEKLYRFTWRLFRPYEMLGGIILLTLKNSDVPTFVLTQQELGYENFNEVCQILDEKLGLDN